MAPSPEISVIVEGYNQTLETGCLDATLAALRTQRFPLARVEVLLVGSAAQAEAWQSSYAAAPAPFHSIRAISAPDGHYYAMKNRGAAEARAEVLAFLDSDVTPDRGWLSAIVAGLGSGAEAVCGPTLFQPDGGRPPPCAPALRRRFHLVGISDRPARRCCRFPQP